LEKVLNVPQMELCLRMASRTLIHDSNEYSERFMGLCDRGHCAMSPNVACGRGFELGVTAFGK